MDIFLKKMFKPYLFFVIVLGLSIFYRYVFLTKYSVSIYSLIFVLFLILMEIYENHEVQELSFSFALSNDIFILLNFGLQISMIGLLFSNLIRTYYCVRKGIYKQLFNVKFFFNFSQMILTIFLTSIFYNVIKNYIFIDYIIYIFIIFFYLLINTTLVTLVITFNSGKFFKDLFTKKYLLFDYYSILFTILLIINYENEGIIGYILVWLVFIPLQKITLLYTKIKYQEEKIFKDNLTKIYNYNYLINYLNKKNENKENIVLTMIDLNNFKEINDNFSHIIGNEVLVYFANMVKEIIKKYNKDEDIVFCRYGGDEFCLVTNKEKTTEKIIKEIKRKLKEKYYQSNDKNITLEISISEGSYFYQYSENIVKEDFIKEIIETADKNMYYKKRQYKNKKEG